MFLVFYFLIVVVIVVVENMNVRARVFAIIFVFLCFFSPSTNFIIKFSPLVLRSFAL